MSAILRISGNRSELLVQIAASDLPFAEAQSSVRERRLYPTKEPEKATYNLTISSADGDSVPLQIEESIECLRQHGSSIAAIHRAVEESSCNLDFSWEFPDRSPGQYSVFPHELIELLANHGIELSVSVYGAVPKEKIKSST